MGTDDLHGRLAELPGVVKCTVTDETVALFVRPDVDPRLLKARAQVACAESGETRPLIVVGGLPNPAAATTAAGRTSLGARTRRATPISLAVASLFVLSAVALVPTGSDRPSPPRVDAPPSVALEPPPPRGMTVPVPAEPPGSTLLQPAPTSSAAAAARPAPARFANGRALSGLTSELLPSTRTATSGVLAALADAAATAGTAELVVLTAGLPPRTATSPAPPAPDATTMSTPAPAPDAEATSPAPPAPDATTMSTAAPVPEPKATGQAPRKAPAGVETKRASFDTAAPVLKRSSTPEVRASGTSGPSATSSRGQAKGRAGRPGTPEEASAPRTEKPGKAPKAGKPGRPASSEKAQDAGDRRDRRRARR